MEEVEQSRRKRHWQLLCKSIFLVYVKMKTFYSSTQFYKACDLEKRLITLQMSYSQLNYLQRKLQHESKATFNHHSTKDNCHNSSRQRPPFIPSNQRVVPLNPDTLSTWHLAQECHIASCLVARPSVVSYPPLRTLAGAWATRTGFVELSELFTIFEALLDWKIDTQSNESNLDKSL